MRLAAGAKIAAAVIALAAALTSCEQQNTAHAGTAPAESRAQVVPAAHELYQTLFRASPRSVDLLDWGYQPCGTGTATLSYSISLRLFAFAVTQDTDFDAYRHQVVSLVRSVGYAPAAAVQAQRDTANGPVRVLPAQQTRRKSQPVGEAGPRRGREPIGGRNRNHLGERPLLRRRWRCREPPEPACQHALSRA